jgi:hypothetical protein
MGLMCFTIDLFCLNYEVINMNKMLALHLVYYNSGIMFFKFWHRRVLNQSIRLSRRVLEQMVETGKANPCFCKAEEQRK